MDHLRRELAPITGAGWAAVDAEATRTLRHFLAARPLVDFHGPKGWDHSASNLGRTEPVTSAPEGVELRRRLVQPLLEMRTPFTLGRDEVLKSIMDTLMVGVAAATLGVVVSLLVSYIVTRTRWPGRKVLDMMAWGPWAIPGPPWCPSSKWR